MRLVLASLKPKKVNGSDLTLSEARAWLLANRAAGTRCLCCNRLVKIYPRTFPRATALLMIELWRRNEGRDYSFVPDILNTMTGTVAQGGDGRKGWLWGLMEQEPGHRDDGSNRRGWWRLTDSGREFVLGEIRVPQIAYVCNNAVLGYSDEFWSIHDALGSEFNYAEMMERPVPRRRLVLKR